MSKKALKQTVNRINTKSFMQPNSAKTKFLALTLKKMNCCGSGDSIGIPKRVSSLLPMVVRTNL